MLCAKSAQLSDSSPPNSMCFLLLLLSRFSHVRLCATPETAAHQAPTSLGFSRQERWSGLPFPSPMHESEKWKWSRFPTIPTISERRGYNSLLPSRLVCLSFSLSTHIPMVLILIFYLTGPILSTPMRHMIFASSGPINPSKWHSA